MAQFLSDTFTGTSGDLLETYNPSWAKVAGQTGTASISSSQRARSASGTAVYYRSDALAPSADYTVSARLFVAASTSGPGVGISGRMLSTAATMYHARILMGTGLQLVRYINGSAVTLDTYPYTPAVNDEPLVELVMQGTQLSVKLDGAQVIAPITDSSITGAGYVGLRMVNAGAGQVQVDNISADTLGGAVVPVDTPLAPGAGALSFTGYAPSVVRTANASVSPMLGALTVTGFAPSIMMMAANTISPQNPLPTLGITGFAPSIVRGTSSTQRPGQGLFSISGHAPTIGLVSPTLYASVRYSVLAKTRLPTIHLSQENLN